MNDLIIEKLDRIETLLIKREKPFLTLQEAADYLGVSVNSIYTYVNKRILPYYKPTGRRLYFSIEDLNRFILNREKRRRGQAEIEAQATTQLLIGNRRGKK